MANSDFYLQGTDEQNLSEGTEEIQVYSGVIDVTKLDTQTYASLDVLRLVKFEEGTMFYGADATITEALVNVTAVNFGNTIADAALPDDYLANQTDTAVGNFTTETAGSKLITKLSADGYIGLRLAGTFAGAATGKIAWRVALLKPSKLAKPRAEVRNYPN